MLNVHSRLLTGIFTLAGSPTSSAAACMIDPRLLPLAVLHCSPRVVCRAAPANTQQQRKTVRQGRSRLVARAERAQSASPQRK
eukprot:689339-Rhodomonas_salina.2